MNPLVLLLRAIKLKNEITQRELSELLGFSLGKINTQINEAEAEGYLSSEAGLYTVTAKGDVFLDSFKVDNAIILAAGFGSRAVPLTYETPKGLLSVHGVPMIERQIEQLIDVGIKEIIIVVGYLKEKFDYMIDKYGVTLIYNSEFAAKNNFVSVYCAREYLKNSYLLVADNYIVDSIFNTYEPNSWLSSIYFNGETSEWVVETTASGLINKITVGGVDSWALIGPAYFTADDSAKFKALIEKCYKTPGTDNYYWEDILKDNLKDFKVFANKQDSSNVYEFESLDELRVFDNSYINDSNNEVMDEISRVFGIKEEEISGIIPLKAGITNESFIFSVASQSPQRFVYRRPGIGTDKLINRAEEKLVYEFLVPLGVSDEIVYFDATSGNRITKYYEDARISDAFNDDELQKSMDVIKIVHDAKIDVPHFFDIAKMIDYYRDLCAEVNAIRFSDVDEVEKKVSILLDVRKKLNIPQILCHGDALHANVLILPNGDVKLIDWEYSGKSDPIMDVSMFGIYSYFDKERLDLSLRMYLGRDPSKEETTRLYLYVALAGFLWSMWAEYKQALGQEFDEYPMIMYRYMKDYYKLLQDGGYLDV